MTSSLHNDWHEPISLDEANLPPFPQDVFPVEIQEFIVQLAKSTETPLELASLTVLSGISTAAQGKYIVQVKTDYFEPVNVWTVVGLPPGCRKSAVQKAVTEPLTRWEQQKKQEMEPLIAQLVSNNKTLEMRIKEMRKMAASAKPEAYEKIQQDIMALEQTYKEPPGMPQLWTADITPENLGTLMAANHECMAVLSDEAGVFDILAGRYSQGVPNLDLFLQAHAGSSVRVNRGSRPPVFLDHPVLTMGLTPQPDVLRGLTKTPAFRGRGLLGRFLYAIPPSNLGTRLLNAEPLPEDVKMRYETAIAAILNHPNNAGRAHILKLTQDAFEIWRDYALAIEVRMSEDGPFVNMRDWAGKLPGAIARIAGLLHIARYAKGSPSLTNISKEDMVAAIRIGHVLCSHALAVFDLMGADSCIEGARSILRWIKKHRWEAFTFRDCHYAHKSKFKRAKDMESSLEILEERHFIREIQPEKKAHRPSRFFIVNLKIHKIHNKNDSSLAHN